MNKGSAQIIIVQVFTKLMNGERFTRTLSVAYFECFLNRILNDYGTAKLTVALSALKMHIDYIADRGDSKIKLRKVYQRYMDDLSYQPTVIDQDEVEQKEISEYFKNNKSKAEIVEELRNAPDREAETININHKTYKRDNKTIALIKILRNFECQICGLSITKRDGSKYVEAAHIIPKHKKGKESPENIILLCPNHHKEFDLGNCEINKHSKNQIKFVLNGKKYNLSLAFE
jgi:predicted restriction endonuclease